MEIISCVSWFVVKWLVIRVRMLVIRVLVRGLIDSSWCFRWMIVLFWEIKVSWLIWLVNFWVKWW